jgi:hypothetical protein
VKTALNLRNHDIKDIMDFKNLMQPLLNTISNSSVQILGSNFRKKCVADMGDNPGGIYNNFLLFSSISVL